MANTDIPSGLTPVGHLTNASWFPKLRWCYHPATDGTGIFMGDAVTIVDASTLGAYPTVEQADAGDRLFGVAVAFRSDEPEGPTTSGTLVGSDDIPRDKFCAASTAGYIGVITDPGVIYEIQEDSDSVNLAAGNIMACVDLIVGSGSTTTGISAMEIDSSTVTASDSGASAAQLQILRLAPGLKNSIGTNAKWHVRIFESDWTATTPI